MSNYTAAQIVKDAEIEGAANVMIARGLEKDLDALRLLAGSQADPVEFAVQVALAAREVMGMTSLRVNQAPLFELEEAHKWALSNARECFDTAAHFTAHPQEWDASDEEEPAHG